MIDKFYASELIAEMNVDMLHSRPRAIHGFYPPISVYRAMLERMNQSNESIQYPSVALVT